LSRNSKYFLFLILGIWVFIGVVAIALLSFDGDSGISPLNVTNTTFTKRPAPDFELEFFSGEKVKLSDLKGEKGAVINFWASWCGPCRTEGGTLAKIGKEYDGKVRFIGVAVNDQENNAKDFLNEFGITYDNGMDTSNIAGSYKITGIPETFWVDKDGNIVDHVIGPVDEAGLVSRIEKIL